jgi:hypothetical protein
MKTRMFFRMVALALLVAVHRPALAQFTLMNLGHAGGPSANSVVLSGDYAYVAGEGLQIFNISDPANPILTGSTNNGVAYCIAVSGHYAFLACSGLRIYDISNPANPVNVGYTNNGGTAQGVAVSGDYAFVANGNDGLRIYDISDPTNLINVGHTNNFSDAKNGSVAVAVSGSYAYVANMHVGLLIYDISNRALPQYLGQAPLPPAAYGVAVSGNLAFIACGQYGMYICDVSNPAIPVRSGFVANDVNSFSWGVAVSGSRAYVCNMYSLAVVDVSNPATPAVICRGASPTPPGIYALGAAASGQHVYVAIEGDGLRTYQLAGPALACAATSTNTLRISWPTNAVVGVLELSWDLATTGWQDVTNTPVVLGDRNEVVLPASGTQAFYRLRFP